MNSKGVGEANSVAEIMGVAVGIATCASVTAVPTVDMAGAITSVGLVVGVDMKLLQDASIAETRNKAINVLSKIFTFLLPLMSYKETPNGLRYPSGNLHLLRDLSKEVELAAVRITHHTERNPHGWVVGGLIICALSAFSRLYSLSTSSTSNSRKQAPVFASLDELGAIQAARKRGTYPPIGCTQCWAVFDLKPHQRVLDAWHGKNK